MSFMESIVGLAKSDKKTIVLPEASDPRTIEAAHKILEQGLANLILIGSNEEISAKSAGFNISEAKIIDPNNFDGMPELVQKLTELRKSKGMTPEEAEKLLKQPLYLGVMLVKEGLADGMVAGAVHSTADVLRPSLQILKTLPGTKTVSSFFVMIVPDCQLGHNGTFLFSDCALVQNPTAEELAAIAISSAESFKSLFDAEPVVAMLSHSTKGSAKHADIDKVVEAVNIAKSERPDLMIDGELQLDAAIIESVGKSKAPGSPVAGKANVLVFPDLDAANIGYKLVQRLAKAEAYGPVCQGIGKPVNDLSRGCSADDIVGVAAITCVQAQRN